MILLINTASNKEIVIGLQNAKGKIIIKKIKVDRNQSEKLLSAINKLLIKEKIKLNNLKKIIVNNQGGSFTSLRIGVVTANALAYALGIPIESENGKKTKKIFSGYSIIEPIYDTAPNIGKAKMPVH